MSDFIQDPTDPTKAIVNTPKAPLAASVFCRPAGDDGEWLHLGFTSNTPFTSDALDDRGEDQ